MATNNWRRIWKRAKAGGEMPIVIYPAGPPLRGKWVLMYQNASMSCPGFLTFDTIKAAVVCAVWSRI